MPVRAGFLHVERMTGALHHGTPRARTDSICTKVICAIAEAKGVDPLDLDPELVDVVDPDALERLFRYGTSGDTEGRVTFTMAGCEVVVRSTGSVTAAHLEDGPGALRTGSSGQGTRQRSSNRTSVGFGG